MGRDNTDIQVQDLGDGVMFHPWVMVVDPWAYDKWIIAQNAMPGSHVYAAGTMDEAATAFTKFLPDVYFYLPPDSDKKMREDISILLEHAYRDRLSHKKPLVFMFSTDDVGATRGIANVIAHATDIPVYVLPEKSALEFFKERREITNFSELARSCEELRRQPAAALELAEP